VGLRLVYLTISRLFGWLQLSRHSDSWKSAEILLLRHQLTVLQRQAAVRPKLSWADRALIALLLDVIPKQRRAALRLIVTPETIALAPRDPPSSLDREVSSQTSRPPAYAPQHHRLGAASGEREPNLGLPSYPR
jgi:hypothetical protein